jgi:hypothetical protein
MDEILKKSYRIFLLAAILFIAGFLFFARQYIFPSNKQNINGQQEKMQLTLGASGNLSSGGNFVVSSQENNSAEKIKNFPPPETFRTFHYVGDLKSIKVSGSCSDSYYAILIFQVGLDYRADPAVAKYNTAFPCPPEKIFSQNIVLDNLGFEERDYYIIRAQQGNSGMWYSPY